MIIMIYNNLHQRFLINILFLFYIRHCTYLVYIGNKLLLNSIEKGESM